MNHVLHIISGLGIGGAEAALFKLVSGSNQIGDKHSVVVLKRIEGMEQDFFDAKISVEFFSFDKNPIREFFKLVTYIRNGKFNIVQTWMYHADLIGGLAAFIARSPNIIWGVRTTGLSANSKFSTKCVRFVCARLSHWIPKTIVYVANSAVQSHIEVGYSAKKICVIPNGFNLDNLQFNIRFKEEFRKTFNIAKDELIIGTVGRFNPAKDYENFVKACGIVAKNNPQTRFLMIGKNLDDENGQLKSWIQSSTYPHNFVLLGEQRNIANYLSTMDIFCLSSRIEGFPNVIGEAMAVGIPCVVTDAGDSAYIVGDSGVVVEKENSEQLGSALISLINKSDSYKTNLKNKAKERIQSEFTIKNVVLLYQKLYKSINGVS